MSELLLTAYLVYLGIVIGALFAAVWWLRRRRKSKLPFDEKIERVMRTPGEGARQKVDQLTDKLLEDLFGAFLTPLAVLFVFAIFIKIVRPTGSMAYVYFYSVPAACLLICAVFVYRMSRRTIERSDWRLGQYGERNVADNLDPLRQRGWRVFHDVPAERKGKKFNIDHVVVGSGGVFAIETKTPRRPEMSSGVEEHVVEYDGERLRWPNGFIDSKKPRMAQARAEWLHTWLVEQGVGVLEVVPILTIPWWFVRPVGSGGYVQAVNPGQLIGIIGSCSGVLTAEQVSAISTKLELRCRDVEY